MQANTKKLVVAGSILGALAITVTAIILSKRKKLEAKIKAGSQDVIAPAQSTTTMILFPLHNGSGKTVAEKNAVKVVQRYINAKSTVYSWLQVMTIKEDGLFGPLTEAALVKIAGVKEVSYSFYLDMQSFLQAPQSTVPDLLSPGADPYNSDPSVQKNNLIDFTGLGLL